MSHTPDSDTVQECRLLHDKRLWQCIPPCLPQNEMYSEIRVKSTETVNLMQNLCQIPLKFQTSHSIPDQINVISNCMLAVFMVVRRPLRLGILDQIFSLVREERKYKGILQAFLCTMEKGIYHTQL